MRHVEIERVTVRTLGPERSWKALRVIAKSAGTRRAGREERV
jgi:hypothetical protein